MGILAHLTGYDTLFMHAMQVREIVQDLKETVFGNRMDLAALCIGGVRYDLDAETTAYLTAALDKVAPEAADARQNLPQQRHDPAPHERRGRADAGRSASLRRGRAGRPRIGRRLRRARSGTLRGL